MNGRVIRVEGASYEYGECPLNSTVAAIPKVSPLDPKQVDLAAVKLSAPCVGGACGWWSKEKNHCSVLCVSEVANKLDSLMPSNGQGALVSIAESLETLVNRKPR